MSDHDPLTLDAEKEIGELLVRADSICSLVGHRYGSQIPADLKAELLAVSQECRRVDCQLELTRKMPAR